MKKILLVMIAFTLSLQAGLWSVVTTAGMEKRDPDTVYKLDTAGWAPRLYEFTTKTEPKLKCVVLFSSSDQSSAPAMQCIPYNK